MAELFPLTPTFLLCWCTYSRWLSMKRVALKCNPELLNFKQNWSLWKFFKRYKSDQTYHNTGDETGSRLWQTKAQSFLWKHLESPRTNKSTILVNVLSLHKVKRSKYCPRVRGRFIDARICCRTLHGKSTTINHLLIIHSLSWIFSQKQNRYVLESPFAGNDPNDCFLYPKLEIEGPSFYLAKRPNNYLDTRYT